MGSAPHQTKTSQCVHCVQCNWISCAFSPHPLQLSVNEPLGQGELWMDATAAHILPMGSTALLVNAAMHACITNIKTLKVTLTTTKITTKF